MRKTYGSKASRDPAFENRQLHGNSRAECSRGAALACPIELERYHCAVVARSASPPTLAELGAPAARWLRCSAQARRRGRAPRQAEAAPSHRASFSSRARVRSGARVSSAAASPAWCVPSAVRCGAVQCVSECSVPSVRAVPNLLEAEHGGAEEQRGPGRPRAARWRARGGWRIARAWPRPGPLRLPRGWAAMRAREPWRRRSPAPQRSLSLSVAASCAPLRHCPRYEQRQWCSPRRCRFRTRYSVRACVPL